MLVLVFLFFFNVYNVVLVDRNIKGKECYSCCTAVTEVARMLRMTGLVMRLVLCCE